MVEDNRARLAQLLEQPHADVDYLKQQDISLVLSKALAETFKAQPLEPKKYFAKYMINYAAQKRKESDRKEQLETVANKKKGHQTRMTIAERRRQEEVKAQQKEEENKAAFFATLEKSKDLADNLPALVNFLKKYTGSTGVYVGRLQHPELKIEIDADDKAHFDYEAPKVVKFIHASEDHEFVEGAVLQPTVGVTHDVFGENYARLNATQTSIDENGVETTTELELMDRFKHYYVKEVVREPRMNFQRVPRLGSFMAIPLVYKSCLFDESLAESVSNWQSVKQQQETQDIAKEEYQGRVAQMEQEEIDQMVPEEFPDIVLDDFRTEDQKYVVCLDTLGQDRELTVEQKMFALDTIERYIQIWEEEERVALAADRDSRLEALEVDPETAANNDQNLSNEITEEVESYEFKKLARDAIYFDKKFPDLDENGEVIEPPADQKPATERIDEELRDIENKYKMLKVIANKFLTNDEWANMVKNLLKYRVQRYPQIIQALMFFTGSKRENICVPETNKLFWKWIREIKHDQIPKAMLSYQMYGETKGNEILPYQTITYCEKILEGVIAEDVETYHIGLGKLYKWLTTALAGRKLDIIRRKCATRKAKEDRQHKIETEEDRKQRREEYLTETKAQWEQDNADELEVYNNYVAKERRRAAGEPVSESEDDGEEDEDKKKAAPVQPIFNQEEALAKFDAKEENAIVIIPAEIIDDIDADWPMTTEEESELIDRTLASRETI